MDHASAFIMGLALIIIATISVIIYFNNQKTRDQLDATLSDIVKQFNDSQFDAFKFDKKQQQEIQNLGSRVDEIKGMQIDLNDNIQSKYQEIRDQIKMVNGVSPEEIAQGIPYVKTGKLQLGDEYLLSGVGYDDNNPDGWLRLMDSEGTGFKGGVASGNLYVDDKSYLKNLEITGSVNASGMTRFKGADSDYNKGKQDTQFPGPSGYNTIGGDTRIHGSVDTLGVMNLNDELRFENVNFSKNGNSFDINLGATPMKITGTDGQLLQELTGTEVNFTNVIKAAKGVEASGFKTTNATIDDVGNIYAKSKVAIGVKPEETKDYMLHVNGGATGQFNTSFQNGNVQVALANNNGAGVRIETKTDNMNAESALAVYSADGELLSVKNTGAISIGRENSEPTIETRVNTPITRVKTYIDAWGSWDKNHDKTLVVGGNSKKVVIGNDENSGNDYAANRTPTSGVIVATNPTYVAKTVSVATKSDDVFPYESGVHATNVHATNVIGVGLTTGNGPKAYMTAQGEIYSASGTLSGSDRKLKQDIKAIGSNEFAKLGELKPVSYELKATPERRHYGFIAQEVAETYPELVSESVDGNKALNYNEFVPLVVGNLQNLNKTIPDRKKLCLGETCITEKDLKLLKSYMP